MKRSSVGEWVSSVDKRRRLNIMYNFDDKPIYSTLMGLLIFNMNWDTQVTDRPVGHMSEYSGYISFGKP